MATKHETEYRAEGELVLKYLAEEPRTLYEISEDIGIPIHTARRIVKYLLNKKTIEHYPLKGENGRARYCVIHSGDIRTLRVGFHYMKQKNTAIDIIGAFDSETAAPHMTHKLLSGAIAHIALRSWFKNKGYTDTMPHPLSVEAKVTLREIRELYKDTINLLDQFLLSPLWEDGDTVHTILGIEDVDVNIINGKTIRDLATDYEHWWYENRNK